MLWDKTARGVHFVSVGRPFVALSQQVAGHQTWLKNAKGRGSNETT
jgi:hypothetical protein